MMRAISVLTLALLLSACTTTTDLAGIPAQKPAAKAPPENRARLHTELAALYYQQNSLKTALNELNTATRIDPSYAPAYSMFGLVYMQLGENAQAAGSFQRAIALAPADPDIRNNYGLFLCHTGQPQAGLTQLETAWQNPLYDTPGVALANASRCAGTMNDTALANRYRQRAERYGVSVDSIPATNHTSPISQ